MFPDDDADIAAMTARIDEQVRQAGEHATAMQEWAAEVEAVTGEGSALRGGVRVGVNSSGVVTSLTVTDAACDEGGRALTDALLSALKEAQQSVGDALGRSAARRFGEDGELTQLMVQDLNGRLGISVDLAEPRTGSASGGRIG